MLVLLLLIITFVLVTSTKAEVMRSGWFGLSVITLHYIILHKIVFRVLKITRIARTINYEIKGVMWEYIYLGKRLEKR